MNFLKSCMAVWVSLMLAAFMPAFAVAEDDAVDSADALQIIVMDPLAAELSCPCVEGYAQRDYQALATHLQGILGRPVKVTFAESLEAGLKETKNKVDLIVGKDSVVRSDAAAVELALEPIAALTDKNGVTTQQGLLVVRSDDPAKRPADLAGYEIFFGPADCDEKHAAAIALLKEAGIAIPEELVIDQSCSDGACKVVEQGVEKRVVAVISSYAEPLLEGCGTVQKGDLRVIGKTEPVPFITAFAPTAAAADHDTLRQALLSIADSPEVCKKMESLVGFVEPAKKK